MENDILMSTKKVLGLSENYDAFDLDIITHINMAFSNLNQLGIGPEEGFSIDDSSVEWDAFDVPINQKSMVKTYVYLRVRLLFDPPGTSFLISAIENQISELTWRLSTFREFALPEEVV